MIKKIKMCFGAGPVFKGGFFSCAFILLIALSTPGVQAATFETKAQFAILLDADTRSVLYEKNANQLMSPASMSKLMTLAVIFEGLKKGHLSLEDEFLISENAWRTGGAPSGTSAMFAKLDSNVPLGELLKGIIIQSGNDACIAIAEGISGSEEAFAEEMNIYAGKLGLKKSSFRNSTGLPHPEHLMTARELAFLASHIIKEYPEHYGLFKQKEYRYGKHKFFNRNSLVYLDIGVDGLKTGYTKKSGYGLVASAVQKGQRLIVVINGLSSKKERRIEGKKLLNWGFRNFKKIKLFDDDEKVTDALVWGGTQRYLPLYGKGEVSVSLPRFNSQKLKAALVYKGPLKPPIKKGDKVAELRVTSSNKATNWIALYAGEDVERSGILSRGFDSLLYLAFGWLL